MNEMSRPPEASGAQAAFVRVARRFQAQDRKVKAGVVVAALVLAVAGYWFLGRGGAPGPQAGFMGGPPPVTVAAPLARTVVEWDEFTGQFEAVEFVEVRARVNGYLQSVHFQDGQMVRKGDLLFVIDPRPYEAALANAEAAVAQYQAQVELATRQLERTEKLRGKDFVSASTYDQRVQEKQSARAQLDAARAQVRTAKLNLDYTRIHAPVAGRVSRKELSVGNLIAGDSGGQPSLLTTIVSLDPIRFVFDMSEQEFLAYQRAVAAGKMKSTRDTTVKVEARLPDEKDWTLQGRMDFVDNRVERSSGTIRARAVFANAKGLVTPGQFGRLRIPGSEPHEVLLLPDAAIMTDQAHKIVMTVKEDGTVVPAVVRTGPMIDGLRVIRAGLEPTDQVIINGLMRARPGGKVTPQPGSVEPPGAPAAPKG